jgi:hypothetical protein
MIDEGAKSRQTCRKQFPVTLETAPRLDPSFRWDDGFGWFVTFCTSIMIDGPVKSPKCGSSVPAYDS